MCVFVCVYVCVCVCVHLYIYIHSLTFNEHIHTDKYISNQTFTFLPI